VWSAWSGYQAYTIVTTAPSIVWQDPAADYGWIGPAVGSMGQGSGTALLTIGMGGPSFRCDPPSGQTLTKVHRKMTRLTDPGAPFLYQDVDYALQPAGGVYTSNPSPAQMGYVNLWGVFQIDITATASGGGVTNSTRYVRFSWGEWQGALALGDQVTNLRVTETPGGDDATTYYRAQSSPTAAAGAAIWRSLGNLNALQAELPPTNAYLGLWTRVMRTVDDDDAMGGSGSFEVTTALPPGWTSAGSVTTAATGNAADGGRVLRLTGDGSGTAPSARSPIMPVVPGATYRLTASAMQSTGVRPARVRLDTYDANNVSVTPNVLALDYTNAAPMVAKSITYTVPADGSVAGIAVRVLLNYSAAAVGDQVMVDAVSLVGPVFGAGGMDALAVTWTSLG
jgi:hypothetical protein